MFGDGCGDHFALYKYIKLLCCTPESNIMLYANCLSVKEKDYNMDGP